MLALETQYGIDLTGEGGIGDSIAKVVWSPGFTLAEPEWGVYELSSGSIAIDNAALPIGSPAKINLTLTSRGKLWSVPRSTEVIGVLQEEGNYKLVMVKGEGARAAYTIESFNLAGESSGRAEKSSLSEVLALENQYGMDFTGEGGIGDLVKTVLWQPELIKGGEFLFEPIGLYELISGGIAIDIDRLEPGETLKEALILQSRGSLWSLPRNAEVVGVVPEPSKPFAFGFDGYRVVMVTGEGSRAAYTIENFDPMGESLGRAERSSLPEILALEGQYGIDITGDGIISRDILKLEYSDNELSENTAIKIVGTSDAAEYLI